jgi:hypothetical protein
VKQPRPKTRRTDAEKRCESCASPLDRLTSVGCVSASRSGSDSGMKPPPHSELLSSRGVPSKNEKETLFVSTRCLFLALDSQLALRRVETTEHNYRAYAMRWDPLPCYPWDGFSALRAHSFVQHETTLLYGKASVANTFLQQNETICTARAYILDRRKSKFVQQQG